MTRKAKRQKTSATPFFNPSLSWLPAFFMGLCIGILLHLIPGMDVIFSEAKRGYEEEITMPSSPQPIMWRPTIHKHSS